MSESNDKKKEYLKNGPLLDTQGDEPITIDTYSGGFKSLNSDIQRPIKKTLKDYLSAKTIENSNPYPIDKNDKEATIYNSQSPDFTPPLNTKTNENQYKPDFLTKSNNESFVRKGKSEPENKNAIFGVGVENGNSILKDNNVVGGISPARAMLSSTLKKNRFTSENQYSSTMGDKNFSVRKYMTYVKDGELIKLNQEKTDGEVNKEMSLSVDNMNEIAETLMLRASGKQIRPELTSAEGGDNNAVFGPGAAVLLPGLAQLFPGLKYSGVEFDVNNIATLFSGEQSNKDIEGLGDASKRSGFNRDTYGVLNNYFDKFTKQSIGTTVLSSAIILATVASLSIVIGLVALLKSMTDEKETEEVTRRKKQNIPSDRNKTLYKVLGIKGTSKNLAGLEYFNHVENGIFRFFSPGNVFNSSGYYIIFCRSIIRDTLDIIDLDPKGTDKIEFWDNLTSYDSIQILSTSKLISAVNLFSVLADIDENDLYSESTHSNTSYMKDTLLQSVFFHKLSLRSLNDYQKTENEELEAFKNIKNITDINNSKNIKNWLSIGDRINSEYNLNSDYLPFYFHDLRDGKIISFFATLNDFKETYSPQWDEQSYFGRVDPIKIYKSTTRKISLSFIIFANDQNDYQTMWDNIQTLTSMVYPKYTEHKKVTLKEIGQVVDVPYSTSFKSQPLIRIKVGELIGNNISPELLPNLKEILEYNKEESTISPTPTVEVSPPSNEISPSINQIKNGIITAVESVYDKFKNLYKEHEKEFTQLKIQEDNIDAEKYNRLSNFALSKAKKGSFKFSELQKYFKNGILYISYNDPEAALIPLRISPTVAEEIKKAGLVTRNIHKDQANIDVKHSTNTDCLRLSNFPDHFNLKLIAISEQNPNGSVYIHKDDSTTITPKDNIKYSLCFEINKKHTFKNLLPQLQTIEAIKKSAIPARLEAEARAAAEAKIDFDAKKAYDDADVATSNVMWVFNSSIKATKHAVKKSTVDTTIPATLPQQTQNTTSEEQTPTKQDLSKMFEESNPFYRAIMNNYGLGAPAYIDSLNYSVKEGYHWEVAGRSGARRPKIIDVSMDLTIIHDIAPFSTKDYKHYPNISDEIASKIIAKRNWKK